MLMLISRRRSPSTTNLANSLAGQLHQAAESVTNLDALVNQNSGFMERISARLNDVINEIDNEILGNSEYVLGMFNPPLSNIPIFTVSTLLMLSGGVSLK